jgi:hypothetical protein
VSSKFRPHLPFRNYASDRCVVFYFFNVIPSIHSRNFSDGENLGGPSLLRCGVVLNLTAVKFTGSRDNGDPRTSSV